jgi:hypothetical protein
MSTNIYYFLKITTKQILSLSFCLLKVKLCHEKNKETTHIEHIKGGKAKQDD